MPFLRKQTISNYLRSGCLRRLRLDLSPDTAAFQQERAAQGMPPRLVRPGLQALASAGEDWENQKLNDLSDAFGRATLIGNIRQNAQGRYEFGEVALPTLIHQAVGGSFIVQAQFDVGVAFRQAFGVDQLTAQYNLQYSQLRPDIIQVCRAGSFDQEITVSGDLVDIQPGDPRLPACH